MSERILTKKEAIKTDLNLVYSKGAAIAIVDNHKRCFVCSKKINHRGFCSEKCHNTFYDKY